jgi:hypothetical protein
VDPVTIWTATVASIGVLVGWRQLARIRATSQADFTFRFIESFFTTETRTLFLLLVNSALAFEVKEIVREGEVIDRLPYFKIDNSVASQLADIASLPSNKNGYSPLDIDDLLLGHFESLGWYVRKRLIGFDVAYSTFSYYVIASFENQEAQKYLADPDNKDIYTDFPNLYKRFHKQATRTHRLRPHRRRSEQRADCF